MKLHVFFSRLLTRAGLSCALALSASVAAHAAVPNPLSTTADVLLQDVVLGGQQQTAEWNDLSSRNSILAPSVGTGSITPFASGYKASAGFYSYSNDYATTLSIAASTFSIKSVVVQAAMMANPDFYNPTAGTGSVDALLFFNYNNQDHGTYGHANPVVGSSSYNTALNNISVGVVNYQGGPVLSYVVGGQTYIYQGPPVAAVQLGAGVYSDAFAGMEGTYFNFAWQWDLSGIEGITSVSVTVPVVVHQSMIGTQITVGDTFSGSAIPEPSTYAAICGGTLLVFAFWRRRARA